MQKKLKIITKTKTNELLPELLHKLQAPKYNRKLCERQKIVGLSSESLKTEERGR